MNPKAQGEKGQRIAIGELAKLDVDVAVPLTDNLPWDFIIIYNNKLFKTQVKSGTQVLNNGSVTFGLRSNNWNKKTIRKYSAEDCDVVILCDYINVYLLGPEDFSNRNAFTVRKAKSLNGQSKGMNMHDDYVLSKSRLDKVLTLI